MTVYKNGLGDCTAGGLSSIRKSIVAHFQGERNGAVDGKGWNMDSARMLAQKLPVDDVIIVEDVIMSERRLRAIPVALIQMGAWVMYGGNFLHTSDSRGFHHPIKIHDRIETEERPIFPPERSGDVLFSYHVAYGGGKGPDVWDDSEVIQAHDMQDAARQAQGLVEDNGGWVWAINQQD